MKTRVLLPTVILAFWGLVSCGKYEEGPEFSLLTKKARLTNTKWQFEKVIRDGDDVTDAWKMLYTDYLIEFKKDGSYFSIDTRRSIKGTWELDDEKELLLVTPEGSKAAIEYYILRLKNNSIWLLQYAENVEFHFKPH